MGTAFGISLEDVQTVLSSRFGIEASDDEAQAFYDDLCHDLIEDVALNGDDMDEQTDYAHDEIAVQLSDAFVARHAPLVLARCIHRIGDARGMEMDALVDHLVDTALDIEPIRALAKPDASRPYAQALEAEIEKQWVVGGVLKAVRS